MDDRKSIAYCPHCDPYKVRASHIPNRIMNMLSLPWLMFPSVTHTRIAPSFLYTFANRFFNKAFVRGLLTVRVLQEVNASDDDEGLYNRSLVVVREARKQGVHIKAIKLLGKTGTGLYSMERNGKKVIFDGLPHADIEEPLTHDFSDKNKLKHFLHSKNVPYPHGKVFKHHKSAIQFVEKELGFPVVVKPPTGSLSRHTFCNINTPEELEDAVRAVQLISNEFLVEKFIRGDVHRVTVVGGDVLAACRRELPNVVGDGKHTIRELIEIKNQHLLRGEHHQKNYTLKKISLNDKTIGILKQQGMTFDHILPKDKKVYLHDKLVLSAGADIHDVTDVMHRENIQMFERVYDACGSRVIGVDFIAQDISMPYYEQNCGVIEVNGVPYIDMHHYPVTGKSRNVAGAIVNQVLKEL